MFSCNQCLKTYGDMYLSAKNTHDPTCLMCAKKKALKEKTFKEAYASKDAKIIATEGQVYFGSGETLSSSFEFESVGHIGGVSWDHPDADPMADMHAWKNVLLKSSGSFTISGAVTYDMASVQAAPTHLSPTGKRSHDGPPGECMINSCVASRGKSKTHKAS